MGKYRLSSTSEKRIEGILPVLKEIIIDAISREDCPEDFGIPKYGGLRTSKDQAELYAIGRTIDIGSKPVTYADGVNNKSNHQEKEDGYGHAFDVYIYDHLTKSATWDIDRLTRLSQHLIKVAREHGVEIEWGGNWKKIKDYPHFQFKSYISK